MNYSNIMIYILLTTYTIKLYQKRKYIYNKFLLERYLYNIKFDVIKIIKNNNNMYKNRTHIIKKKNIIISETDALKQIFTK